MKVVVFAHTPPPHHGQSYMVELMLRGFEDPRHGIKCYHVNAQFAADSADIGKFRFTKAFRLLGYCLLAIWFRVRHGAEAFYYVPTPPLRNPLFRDWAVLTICRPFFRKTILHWHAVGLGEWIQTKPEKMRRMTQRVLGGAEMSISLGRYNETDAAHFAPKASRLVPNGIPDPCPNFEELRAARKQRFVERAPARSGPVTVRVTYLGLCTKEKGLVDAMRGAAAANARCISEKTPLQFELEIAGPFFNAESESLYCETHQELGNPPWIRHIGFVGGEAKRRLLMRTDILCFPTYYYGESFGLVAVEAMAYGAAVIASRWRSVPDLLPANYPGLVDPKSPEQIAAALIALAQRDDTDELRQRFLENYTVERFLKRLSAAFRDA